MEIGIKNNFCLRCGHKEITYHNTVLETVKDFFSTGADYTGFIAVGSGRHPSTAGVTALQNKLGVYPALTIGYNYDPLRGALFIKKYAEIPPQQLSGATISEIGFTCCSGGEIIANYAVSPAGGGTLKQAGKKLIITATVYLDINLSGQALLIGGDDNPLIMAALGQLDLNTAPARAVLSDCVAGGTCISRRSIDVAAEFGCTVAAAPSSGTFYYTGLLNGSARGSELILMVGGKAAVRLSAVKSGYRSAEQLTVTFNAGVARADRELAALSPKPGLDYNYFSFFGGSSDIVRRPLEMDVTRGAKVYPGLNGYFAVDFRDLIKAYLCRDGRPENIPFEQISFGFYDVTGINVSAAGEFHFMLSKSPYKAIYRQVGGVLRPVSGVVGVAGATEKLQQNGGINYLYRTEGSGATAVTKKYRYQIVSDTYSEVLVSEYALGSKVFFDSLNSGEIVIGLGGAVSGNYPSLSPAAAAALNAGGSVLLRGGTLLCDEGDGRWKAIDIASGQTVRLGGGNVRRVYSGAAGDYFALKHSDNSISGLYFTPQGGLQGYDIALPHKSAGEITDIDVISGGGFLVNIKNRNTGTYFLPLDKRAFVLSAPCADGENEISVEEYSFGNRSQLNCAVSIMP